MKTALPLIVAVLLLAPCAAAQVTPDRTAATDTTADVDVPDDGPFVRLYTGRVVEGEISLRTSRGVPEYVVVNGTEYAHFQVHSYRIDDDIYGFANVGLPRPLLVRQHTDGRVNVYHEANRSGSGSYFFRMGNEPIQIASSANLRSALGDNPEAMRHLQRDRMLGYVGVGGFVVGGALVLTGAAVQFGELDSPASGVIIAGSGVAFAVLVNALVPGARQNARRAAIDAYNR